MSKMQKTLLAGMFVAALGVSAVAVQARPIEGPRGGCAARHFDQGRSAEQMVRRQAELHDKLGLKEDQEAAWKTFMEKSKPAAPANRQDWSSLSQLKAPERMEKMLSLMKEREARMSEHLEALKVFYAVLTPDQQKIFDGQFSRHQVRGGR